jgi:hypothetical protein
VAAGETAGAPNQPGLSWQASQRVLPSSAQGHCRCWLACWWRRRCWLACWWRRCPKHRCGLPPPPLAQLVWRRAGMWGPHCLLQVGCAGWPRC